MRSGFMYFVRCAYRFNPFLCIFFSSTSLLRLYRLSKSTSLKLYVLISMNPQLFRRCRTCNRQVNSFRIGVCVCVFGALLPDNVISTRSRKKQTSNNQSMMIIVNLTCTCKYVSKCVHLYKRNNFFQLIPIYTTDLVD